MDNILTVRPTEVITVHHGNIEGFGFVVAGDCNVGATADVLRHFMDDGITDQDLGTGLSVSTPRATELRGKMRSVQGLRIVDFQIRACNIGDGPDTLSVMRDFFGTRHIGAPIVADWFSGQAPFNDRNPDQLTALRQRADVRAYPRVGQAPSQNLEVCVRKAGSQIFVYALNDATVRARWMTNYFALNQAFQQTAPWLAGVYLHGLLVNGQLILPAENAFLNNIVAPPPTLPGEDLGL